jgi:hypothetical protein
MTPEARLCGGPESLSAGPESESAGPESESAVQRA